MSIQNILSFTKFLNQFREIERSISYTHNPRKENDAEHCRQMSMTARYIISLKELPLSLEKVLQYCLIHDIPEMYAGDIEALKRTPEQQRLKEEREKAAMERIEKEFPEAHPLRTRIEQYERKEDEESKFVFALDKILPVMNIYNDGGHRWKEKKIGLEAELIPAKYTKVQTSAEIAHLWDELVIILKEQESTLFYKA